MEIPGRLRAAYLTDIVDASRHLRARSPLESTRLDCSGGNQGQSAFAENPNNNNLVTFEGNIILLEGAKASPHNPPATGTRCTHYPSDYEVMPLSNPYTQVNENDDLITIEGVKVICVGDLLKCGSPIVSNEVI